MGATFLPSSHGVIWNTQSGPVCLSETQCERLLDLFEDVADPAAIPLFNSLYDAHMACGGIERTTKPKAA